MTVLPGDLTVFRNKWCGLSGDLSVTLVLGIMCRHSPAWEGRGEPAQRWESQDLSRAPTPAEPVLGRGGRKTTVLNLRWSLLRADVLSRGPPHLGAAAALQRSPGGLFASIGGVSILLHVPLLFSLRYNSHIIKLTLLQCAMLWLLVYSQRYTAITTFITPKGNPVPICRHSPCFLPPNPWQPLICFFVYVFAYPGAFHINELVCFVTVCDWCLSLSILRASLRVITLLKESQ